jgi:predicted  nucleic acid-binding Zn-ribbon protein
MATLDDFNKKMTELERKISSLSPNNSGFKQMLDNIKAAEQAGASLNDQYAQAETLLESVNREISILNKRTFDYPCRY